MSAPWSPVSATADRLAVFGDLHLGRPGSPLACTIPVSDLAAARGQLEVVHDLVVVNGDLYDLERGTTPLQGREYRLLEPIHRAAEEALSGDSVVWTRGNHDRFLARLGRTVDAIDVATPAGRFRVEHGDRFDPPIKRFPPFTTLVTWASGRARTVPHLMPAYRAMRLAESMLGRVGSRASDPVTGAARQWLEMTPDVDGLIIGHTHEPLLQRVAGGRLLANPGPSLDRLRVLSIDGPAAVATLLEWVDGTFEEMGRIDLRARR